MSSPSIATVSAPLANPGTNHSTGPRTPEGKARSSQNARKHGLSATTLNVLPHEQAEFDEYQNELYDEIKPQPGLQADLFRQLLHAGWSLVRLENFELEILEQGNPFDSPEAQSKLDRLERYRTSHRRAYSRILAELRKLQTDEMLWSNTADCVQEHRVEHYPMANPSARPLNRQVREVTERCERREAENEIEALQNMAVRLFNKTNSNAGPASDPIKAC